MFYLTMHSTHFVYRYGIKHTLKDYSESERKPAANTLWLLFLISSKNYFIYIIPHCLCYTSCGALAGKTNSSIGSPWGIDPMTIVEYFTVQTFWHGFQFLNNFDISLQNKLKCYISHNYLILIGTYLDYRVGTSKEIIIRQ